MSFIPVAQDCDFPLQNLPYGVFSTTGNVSRGRGADSGVTGSEEPGVGVGGAVGTGPRTGALAGVCVRTKGKRNETQQGPRPSRPAFPRSCSRAQAPTPESQGSSPSLGTPCCAGCPPPRLALALHPGKCALSPVPAAA